MSVARLFLRLLTRLALCSECSETVIQPHSLRSDARVDPYKWRRQLNTLLMHRFIHVGIHVPLAADLAAFGIKFAWAFWPSLLSHRIRR